MESLGVISKLVKNTATPWLNSFVLVKKPNRSLRAFIDPTDLNKYIVCPVWQHVYLRWNKSLVKGGKILISVWHDQRIFPGPARYWFTCLNSIMAISLSNSWDLSESSLCTCTSDLPGCTNIADNILIFGRTQEEHDSNVIQFLECCLDMNIKHNPEKAQINCKEVPYFGNILCASGIKPDPTKVCVIKDWPVPQSIKELVIPW